MRKIDTSNWKELPLPTVFDMSNTKCVVQKDIVLDSGDIPYVTASSENNGILTYISCSPEWVDRGNCIMIGGKTLTFTYQEWDFCSNDSHNIALYAKDSDAVTKWCYLFLISALRASLRHKYSWGDSISMKRIVDDAVFLPVDSSGNPDWVYMDSFMQDVMNESEADLGNLRFAKAGKTKVNVSGWKRFHLYDEGIFEIDMGTKLDKVKMGNAHPEVNFVGRANTNNGITGEVDRIAGITPYSAGNLTLALGGEYLGSCFVQPREFYTSQNVVVLKPAQYMSDNVKRFIAAMIFRESRMYYKAFIDELNRHIKTDFSFLLPVLSDGSPNWDYMDSYMNEMESDSERKLNLLKACI